MWTNHHIFDDVYSLDTGLKYALINNTNENMCRHHKHAVYQGTQVPQTLMYFTLELSTAEAGSLIDADTITC